MKKFLTFGETMGQYNANFTGVYGAEGSYMLDCAGAESNVAVGLRKLCGSAIEAVWVSRLGDDEAGQFVLDELEGRISVKAKNSQGKIQAFPTSTIIRMASTTRPTIVRTVPPAVSHSPMSGHICRKPMYYTSLVSRLHSAAPAMTR